MPLNYLPEVELTEFQKNLKQGDKVVYNKNIYIFEKRLGTLYKEAVISISVIKENEDFLSAKRLGKLVLLSELLPVTKVAELLYGK